MTKEKAIAWMDRQIEAYRMTREPLSDAVYSIERHKEKEVHMRGVRELAKAVGMPFVIKPWTGYSDDSDPDAEISLVYRGFKFFELGRNVFHEADVCDT